MRALVEEGAREIAAAVEAAAKDPEALQAAARPVRSSGLAVRGLRG